MGGPIAKAVTEVVSLSTSITESERLERNLPDVVDKWKGALITSNEELGWAMYRNMRVDTKYWEEL